GRVSETVTVMATGRAAVMETQVSDLSITARRVTTLGAGKVKIVTKSGPQTSTPRLREYFPETLLWQPSIETDKQGRAEIKFKLADNITTWKMLVVGSTEDGQIGMTEKDIKADRKST